MIEQTDGEVTELLSRGLSQEQRAQLAQITGIMIENAERLRPERQERNS